MKKRVIFSIYIEIPEALLDETGYSKHAEKNTHRGERAGETKDKLKAYKNRLMWNQKWYADQCDADYHMYTYDKQFLEYYRYCKGVHDKLPMYHIVNYYKNHLLQELAKTYDEVFYMDIDIIPRTKDNIFEVHNMNKLWAKNNNDLAEWSKHYDLTKYNSCDRNPGIKYWNCYALLVQNGHDPENDVINTGTVIGGKKAIMAMNWQGEFEGLVADMLKLQEDEATMFPEALHSRFAFDNETMFSYLVKTKKLKYDTLDDIWHGRLPDDGVDPRHKIIHAINKKFELIWDDVPYDGRTLGKS